MNSKRRSTLIGAVVTMPTFCDDNYNLLLDKQRKHINWLIENGMEQGIFQILIFLAVPFCSPLVLINKVGFV